MTTDLKNTPTPHNVIGMLLMLALISCSNSLLAQSARKKILIDVSHGQKFWNDPADMAGMDAGLIDRVKYMTDQITKTAASTNGEIGYLKGKIKPEDLAACNLLFIHIPSSKYDAAEVAAIKKYIENGGSLFLTAEVDYWATLAQTNVNDIVSPFGITFGTDSPDTLSGGFTKPGVITDKKLKVTYHGARIVKGGTPFCFNNQTEEPFGTFKQIKNGGKMVVMGDGMVSLYMTKWKDVSDYQCQEFMQEVFAWLLK
ncbi:MAG: hypothetical protein C0490_01515 [Marivirga sp.]|nr:hypothetical protein [Marivirga sp.]